MKKNKCVFFIDPQSMLNLAIYDYNLLSKLEGDFYFFCSKHYDYKPLKGIRFIPVFAYNKINNSVIKAISYIFSYWIIMAYIIIKRPDIIHIQWLKIPTLDYLFFKFVKLFSRLRIVYTAHNILPHDSGDKYKKIFHKTYRLVDAIIVHTKDTKNQLINNFDLNSGNIHVINHGLLKLEIDEYEYQQKVKFFDQKYKTNGERIIFTSLGEQSLYKGIDVLADVWSTTPELNQSKDCELRIIGRNTTVDLSKLNNIHNVVIDNRKIPNDEFYYLLTHTDVYLLPYRRISQSGALLSAITEHVPILVTEIGGLTEPFEIANIGWTISKTDYHELRNMLIYLCNNKEEIKKIKNSNDTWKKVCDFYDWSRIGKKTQDLYDQL